MRARERPAAPALGTSAIGRRQWHEQPPEANSSRRDRAANGAHPSAARDPAHGPERLAGGDGTAVSAAGVVKSYGEVRALVGVDLDVREGSVLGLLGPNGAGKTTMIRILTTLLKPDGGSATVAGLDVVRDAAALRRRIGLAGQYAAVDENLTGAENLVMVGRLYGMSRAEARTARRGAARALRARPMRAGAP